MAISRNGFILAILGSAYLVVASTMERSVVSTGETHAKGCDLKNRTIGIKAYCLHMSLTAIPTNLPPNTVTLDASYNLIRTLKNDSFTKLQELISLRVQNNLISDLEVGTFLPLTNLQTLAMSRNKLTHLQSGIFLSNPLLTILALSFNNLSSVPTEALSTLRQLRKVYLDKNSIQTADFTAFAYSTNMSRIQIMGNKISSLKISDFTPLQNLSLNRLDLSNNRLHNLPAMLFIKLNTIQQLHFIANKLREFRIVSFLGSKFIGSLSVYGCGIQFIIPLNNFSQFNTTFPTIPSVDITSNRIELIPRFAFWGLNQTRSLKIAENLIYKLFNDSFCGLDSLTHLDISRNNINVLPAGVFSCNSELKELIISYNELTTLTPPSFQYLSVLNRLDLSNNNLHHMNKHQKWNNPALAHINISHNSYTDISDHYFSGDLANLKILDISYNKITRYSPHAFIHASSLRKLYLIFEDVLYLTGTFTNMKNLIELDLSYPSRKYLNSTHQFTGAISLVTLRLHQCLLNGADLFDKKTKSSMFDGLVSLNHLDLRGNYLNDLEPGVFGSLSKLHRLLLSKAHITSLKPGVFNGLSSLTSLYLDDNKVVTTSANLFAGLDHVVELYFRSNSIEILDKNLFATTPHLRHLYLSRNRLRLVQKDTFFPTNDTLLIDVSENPFSCTCELRWFISWLHESNVDLKRINQTHCYNTSFKAVVGLPISMFEPADFCGVNVLLITTLSLMGITVGFLCIMAYRKRWWFNHKLFLLKLAIVGHKERAEEFNPDDYEFHLNLMFHEAQEDWVNRVLKPALEERLPHLENIIYGDDYLELGVFYVNALHNAIENSFKTVMLLSNHCVDDAWFMTKLRMALEHVNDTRLNKVILIFLEDIEDDHLPYLVRLFMSRNKPYMLWTDDEDGQELFWAKFEKRMRANKAINSAIPV